MNPSCHACDEEDAEHVICASCMKDYHEADFRRGAAAAFGIMGMAQAIREGEEYRQLERDYARRLLEVRIPLHDERWG